MTALLSVSDLSKSYKLKGYWHNRKVNNALEPISFVLEAHKTLAIVGESGSGKSVTSRSIMGLLAGNSIYEDGKIMYNGRDLLQIEENLMHEIRGSKISMIFQDPMSSLNPILSVGKQITEALRDVISGVVRGAIAFQDVKIISPLNK